jgi:hypothetical protein
MRLQAIQRLPLFRAFQQKEEPAPREIHGVNHRAAVDALEQAGFWILREGVHVIMTNGTRILTIPCDNPVNGLTMEGIVRDAGLSREKFLELL